jgi:hypothetical protein
MAETEIEAGKCYSAGPEKYRVLAINRGIVTYQSWTDAAKISPLRQSVGLKQFAAAVKKSIACPTQVQA